MKCPKCNAVAAEGNNFCTECGARLIPENKENTASGYGLDVVRNLAQWKIAPGEIARKVSEVDFANISTVSGIVVQPGVTALIYIDGREVAQLSSGIYHFVSNEELEKVMDSRVESSGVRGKLHLMWRSVLKTVLGRKVNEKEQINAKERSVSEIVGMLNERSQVAVYLKRDVEFPVCFGSSVLADGSVVFAPVQVRTSILDVKVGVQMFMKISDFRQFVPAYLASRSSVTCSDVQKDMEAYVEKVLREELCNEEIDGNGIGKDALQRIELALSKSGQYLHGVDFVRVVSVTCNSEEFDRFRKLTQALYCNEKELDYLHRTNDFINRLARETNARKIDEARNELELAQALDSLNRDRLLEEDEFDVFKLALAQKKFKRTSDSQTENELLKISNAQKVALAGLDMKYNVVLAELDAKEKVYDRTAEHELKVARNEVEKNRILQEMQADKDRYQDSREDRSFEMMKRKLDLAMEIDEKMWQQEEASLDRAHMRKRDEFEMEQRAKRDGYGHEEEMARIRAGYTGEQMMAEKLDRLSEDAQVAFAASFASRKEEEAARERQRIYEEERKRQDAMYRDMMDFVKSMGDKNAAVAGARIADMEAQKQEYRENARYQQSRMDHTQDKALEYTTNVRMSENRRPVQDDNVCPACGTPVGKDAKFCPVCRAELK